MVPLITCHLPYKVTLGLLKGWPYKKWTTCIQCTISTTPLVWGLALVQGTVCSDIVHVTYWTACVAASRTHQSNMPIFPIYEEMFAKYSDIKNKFKILQICST